MPGAWMDYNCRSGVIDRTPDGKLRMQFECTCPTGYKFSSAVLAPWTDESLNAYVAELVKGLGERCIAPPPPVAPPVVPPVVPPVAPPVAPELEECEKIGIFDIPKGLRCLWKGLVGVPDRIVDYFLFKFHDYFFRRMALTFVRVQARAMSEEHWTTADTAEFLKPEDLEERFRAMYFNFIEGLFTTFMTGPWKDRWMMAMYNRDPVRMPGPSDLVRFQLREVFDPALRKEQLTPPPSGDFLNYMKFLGFDDFWSDSYWAAHWDLPSLTKAYEMFHRLREEKYKGKPEDVAKAIEQEKLHEMVGPEKVPPFTVKDLYALMKRQDVLPAYIPQLAEIAYNPLTRVDIRRLYKIKELTRSELVWKYKDAGYSPADAEKLAKLAEKEYDPDITADSEASLTDMERGVAIGEITEAEFDAYLKRKYRPDAVKLLKALEKVERAKKRKAILGAEA